MSTAPEPAQHENGTLTRTLLIVIFVGLLIGTAGAVIRLPYAVLLPGPVSNVLGQTVTSDGQSKPVITVTGHETFPTDGTLDFTTVRIMGGPGYAVNVWDVLRAWVDPAQDVYPVDKIFPPQVSQQEVQEENEAQMVDSQQEATAVGLRAAGFTVGQKITVSSVADGAPSGTTFQAGDVLVSVGGTPVTDAASVTGAVQKATPGSVLDVVVERAGAQVPLQAKTGTSSERRTVLGIRLKVDFVFPFTVTIDPGSVGGPSAGLMFSLGVYDTVTTGALTGGKNVAGTGTIDSAGDVGAIGGIRQKLVGAQRGGASYFLAPADNCPDVRGAVPDGLQVVKVATFDDARTAVTKIAAGDTGTLPAC